MKDLLYAIVGLIAAGFTAFEIYSYLQAGRDGTNTPIIIAVICAIVALICGGLFLSNRVNKQEDIHVTE